MLLGLVLLAIGVVGFGLAGYWDLRYTEFPDWLPYSMIILALIVRGGFSFLENDLWIIGDSLIAGLAFLGLGLLLYFSRQWGDGDAWLLGALGFLFPNASGFAVSGFLPFPLTLLFNFLFISLVYLIIYSVFLGLRKREVNKVYWNYLKGQSRIVIFLTSLFFAFSWGAAFYSYFLLSVPVNSLTPMILFPFLLTFILLFTSYARVVEENLFKRRISVKDLKSGDVIMKGRWRGLTEKEISKIKRERRYVWVKEGVRFAPVFLFAMLISLFYGDIILIFI
jgi:Flp pilus assembly protein protease CpaA